MIRRLLALLICSLAAVPLPAQQDAATAELELERVREKIQGLEKQLRRSAAELDTSQKALRAAEVAAGKAGKRLQQLKSERAAAERQLAELKATEARRRNELAGEQALLAEQVRLAYMNGQEEWLRLLLSQQDPLNASRQLVYYTYITRQRSDVIARVREAVAELAQAAAAVAAERARLESLEKEQRSRVAEREAARAERATVVARLNRQQTGRAGEIAGLRKQATDLENLVAELRRALADLNVTAGTAFGKRQGQLEWPADGPVLQGFGQPRADGRLRWDGTLLGAPAGSEVRAVHNGRVVFADWLNGMGLLVVLEHGDGFMTLYGHHQDIVRDVGDWVAPGELLGHVGDSGGQAEAGLYFEIRRNGKPINPKPWMRP